MTPDEFNSIFEKITARCEFPRQVWTYNSEPPPGLICPRRFTEEYWNEFKHIKADEFREVVDSWFKNAKTRKFPFVDELRSLHVELFWSKHQQERDQREREQAIKKNRTAEKKYQAILDEVDSWHSSKRKLFWDLVEEIVTELVPEMFRDCREFVNIARKQAAIRAYEEMTNADK